MVSLGNIFLKIKMKKEIYVKLVQVTISKLRVRFLKNYFHIEIIRVLLLFIVRLPVLIFS